MAAKKPWTDLLDGPGKTGSKRTTAADETKPDVLPTTVHMHTIIGNPENPRTEADYTDEDAEFRELKESMKVVGQLQPAVAMSREAFLAVKPEFRKQLGDKQWVVVLGNRRFHAAKQLGWTKFEIRVRDRLGDEADDKVDEAVVIENIHRKNIPPYKEAVFLRRMLERHGSQEKVAARIGKSQMYVSNRLALLDLDPELREAVDTKQIKVKTAERIARIQDPEQQKALAAKEIRKAQEPKAPRKRRTPPTSSPVQNPVLNPTSAAGPVTANGGGALTHTAMPTVVALPEPRATTLPSDGTADSTWQDGRALMNAAFDRLDAQQRSAFILRYFERSSGVEDVIADMRGNLDTEARTSLAAILQQVAAGLREGP
ncbi:MULTISPECIES: ParB/RepB/Spo0J family partition protein [Streptomyces]|uniref:ParB/RepB/Spo0J family partition protein n=1 Tax=Streptomyces odorifer TaxID=53450 RepID=A0A7Y6CBY7_9ACTN|nr:ParB/RepB/Spo0J family partition protein [Streptomyces odorifer]NUV30790.1 ParB/RepB/Spo0J family partition protein [Streptomyces odorifer]NUV32801.1 ParB/RepB/Spo0J family partition protein [Streptomyces sp. KAI-27]NUV45679.1 ParB/RepB/Spo0J family partition protein [Streptomyces sp. CAI-78]